MTDCPNGELRDQLPELLHERLDASARALVVAHVAECPDCRAELTILQEARIALSSGTRALDVSGIVRVVVERSRLAPSASTWRSRGLDWRIAASILVVALGGASMVVARSRGGASTAAAVSPARGVEREAVGPRPESIAAAPASSSQSAELSAAGGVGDLSDSDLRALMDDLPSLDALPAADPEPVNVRVALPGMDSSE